MKMKKKMLVLLSALGMSVTGFQVKEISANDATDNTKMNSGTGRSDPSQNGSTGSMGTETGDRNPNSVDQNASGKDSRKHKKNHKNHHSGSSTGTNPTNSNTNDNSSGPGSSDSGSRTGSMGSGSTGGSGR